MRRVALVASLVCALAGCKRREATPRAAKLAEPVAGGPPTDSTLALTPRGPGSAPPPTQAPPPPTPTSQNPGHGNDPVIPWGAFRITNGAVTNVGGYRISGAPARKEKGRLSMKLSIDGQQDKNEKPRQIDATPGDEIEVGKNRYKVIDVKPSPSDGRDSLFIAPTDTGY